MSNTTKKSMNPVVGAFVKVRTKLIDFFKHPKLEQQIALFGESGSGKTTLLTVFYGYQHETNFQKEAGYRFLADDTSQGQNLLSSFYKIKSLSVPPTRLTSRKYSFAILLEGVNKEAGRMVWHDYPGEWFTETKSDNEQIDKEQTFLSLLSSDVALFLVDGAKLKKSGENYLKSLLDNFKKELSRLKNYPTIKDEFPLTHFPRIWLICLSKSDLMPEMTVEDFRQMVIHGANDELQAVRNEIREIIEEPDLFNLGEDYLLLSAFEFDDKNESLKNMENRKGVDLIAPIAFTVPFKRSKEWHQKIVKRTSKFIIAIQIFRKLITCFKWLPNKYISYWVSLIELIATIPIEQLKTAKEEAIKKGKFIEAILIAFEKKLIFSAETDKTFICRNEETIG